MKKIITTLILGILCCLTSMAQWEAGVSLGVNSFSFYEPEMNISSSRNYVFDVIQAESDPSLGLQGGFYVQYLFPSSMEGDSKFGFRTGFNYVINETVVKQMIQVDRSGDYNTVPESENISFPRLYRWGHTYNQYSFNLPVRFIYQPIRKLDFLTGVDIDFMTDKVRNDDANFKLNNDVITSLVFGCSYDFGPFKLEGGFKTSLDDIRYSKDFTYSLPYVEPSSSTKHISETAFGFSKVKTFYLLLNIPVFKSK